MRPRFLLILSMCFFFSNSFAQEHELSLGVGRITYNQIYDIPEEFGKRFASIFPTSGYLKNSRFLGEIRLAYAYTIKERWGFGSSFSYNSIYSDILERKTDIKIGKRTLFHYTFAGEIKYAYYRKENMRLYALVGAGTTIGVPTRTNLSTGEKATTTDTYFNYQVTPFGIRFGKEWGGFAEAGVIGYRGIFSVGVFYLL